MTNRIEDEAREEREERKALMNQAIRITGAIIIFLGFLFSLGADTPPEAQRIAALNALCGLDNQGRAAMRYGFVGYEERFDARIHECGKRP